MTRALGEAGDFASAGVGDADVTIADRAGDIAGPVIALVPAALVPSAEAAAWRCDVRAVVPADVNDTPDLLYRTQVRTVGSLYHRDIEAFARLRAAWRVPPSDPATIAGP